MEDDTEPRKVSLMERLQRYSQAPFHKDSGFRRDLIIRDLANIGLEPHTDYYGNVYAKKGEGKPVVLLSSHMDTVFGKNPWDYRFEARQEGNDVKITGTLDNSVGCAISAQIAATVEPEYTVMFAFTVKEEPVSGEFCYGAEMMLRTLKSIDVSPGLFVVLDATYPDRTQQDPTPAYAENFAPKEMEKTFSEFVAQKKLDVKVRPYCGADETFIYGKLYNAFALGPVVHGDMHGDNCTTNLKNVEAPIAFLEKLLADRGLLDGLTKIEQKDDD